MAIPRISTRALWKYRFLYLMFLPTVVYFILFSYFPFFKGIVMSFQANRLIGTRPFVGFANYSDVMGNPDFIQCVVNSLIIGVADLALYFALSLLLALLINEVGSSLVRRSIHTIAYLPYLFSWSVIGGIWAIIFDRRGIVNIIRETLGLDNVFFMVMQEYARPLVIGMGIWRSIGYYALLYSVAITAIDPTLFEAARIDGAGRLTQIRRIIIPALTSTMKVVLVLLSIGVLTHFDEIYVWQNPNNKRMIQTLLSFVFDTGIINFKLGIATAGATLVMIGSLSLAGVTRLLTGYDE
jgi:putative aldouronate transport system permease protein